MVVRSLAQANGGQIDYDLEGGSGARFVITLPDADAVPQTVPPGVGTAVAQP